MRDHLAGNLPIDPDLAPDDPAEPSLLHHPGHASAKRSRASTLLAVMVGGFLGTAARDAVVGVWPTRGHFPLPVLVINISGGFLLGIILTNLLARRSLHPRNGLLRPFLATGVLGGWTTYSSFAVASDTLLRRGRIALAIAYVAATLFAGLLTTIVGIAIGRRIPLWGIATNAGELS